MTIKVGDKIRYAATQEEGAVVATSDNTPVGLHVDGYGRATPYRGCNRLTRFDAISAPQWPFSCAGARQYLLPQEFFN
jgi:hypothetical protein